MIYKRAIKPLLFRLDPEIAHERTMEMLAGAGGLPIPAARRAFTHDALRICVAGLEFPNPVGLAAGCDKNGKAIAVWPRFGFGFVEVGTITAQPQPGNPKPRIFRFPEHQALVNRLGFNSDGSEVVRRRIERIRRKGPLPVPLGINIGKTKLVTGDEAVLEDYLTGFRRLSPLADFMVVNVSSPNTPGLRQWQEKERLSILLNRLMQENRRAGQVKTDSEETDNSSSSPSLQMPQIPLFVKISPDMADRDMDDVVEVALEQGLAGIIATNTTIAREGRVSGLQESGGLSGRPLRDRAQDVMRYLYRRTEGRLPLIGVGGIFTAEDAYERIQAGASLVQIYTGFIYEGPTLPRRINEGLLRLMKRDGVGHISEIIGVKAKS